MFSLVFISSRNEAGDPHLNGLCFRGEVKRHSPDALSCSGEDRIGNCWREGWHRRFAHARRVGGAGHDVDIYIRSIVDAEQPALASLQANSIRAISFVFTAQPS
jgi:hypothetical protein